MKTSAWTWITVLAVMLIAAGTQASNPAPVQTFYLPFPEAQLLQGLQAITATSPSGIARPANPMYTYISIASALDDTIIYYDQWESGYEQDIANPQNIYSLSNPGGTQIWGDADPSNGAPPGIPSDIINAGTVIILTSTVYTTSPLTIDFDGRDKLAATKNIAVTRTGWASGSGTLLAGSVEVLPTSNWGTEHRSPVGVNIPNNVAYQMFEYTALAVMAGDGGATVQIDKDANGTFETTVALSEGQGYLVDGGVRVGGQVVSDKPVQVHILTGDIGSYYESRDSALLPVGRWSSDYYAPVSTVDTSSDRYGTTVWLYNPGSSSLSVEYRRRTSSSNFSTTTLTVPGGSAGGYLKQVIPDGYGARFFTQSGQPFYAYSTTDSTDSSYDSSYGYYGNQAYDWSFTLVPSVHLTPQVLVGLGLGRDPTSPSSPSENGNPIWVTPVGNGHTPVTIYVDYDADPTTGPNLDPNGNRYDVSYSSRELDRLKIYNPSGDQTGMLIYTLTHGVTLAAAWGQDPQAASAGAPGLDVGTGVLPLASLSASKGAGLSDDKDGNGSYSEGDEVLYTITVVNAGRAPIPNVSLVDNLPPETTYVPNSTFFKNASGVTVQILDDVTGTPFPLDGVGVVLDPANPLPVGGSYEVTLRVTINLDLDVGQIVNTGTTTALNITIPFDAVIPLWGSIGDFVWDDADEDGIQDVGELGIDNITVELYKVGGPVTPEATTQTDNTGYYLFDSLVAGDYYVKFIKPIGRLFSPQFAGSDTAKDSDADTTTGQSGTITLLAGQSITTVDAGMHRDPVLVTLMHFGAIERDGAVVVQWTTGEEFGTIGFFVERRVSDSEWTVVNADLIQGNLFSTSANDYEYVDVGAAPGATYTYRLVEIENTGNRLTYGPFTADITTATVTGSSGESEPVLSAPVAAALAPPAITDMKAVNGNIVLRWASEAGLTYSIERIAELGGTSMTIATGVPATPPENTVILVDGAAAGFFVIQVED